MVETGDVAIPAEFRFAVYESLVERVRASGAFKTVYRAGDHAADGVPDLVTLHTRVDAFNEGSQTKRELTTVLGATSTVDTLQLITSENLSVLNIATLLGAASTTPYEATYIWGRGKWVDATSNSSGIITLSSPYTRRTPWFLQSDLNLSHEIKVGDHKSIKFMFTAANVINEHSVVAYWAGLDSNYFHKALRPLNPVTGKSVSVYDGASLYQTLETGYSITTPLQSIRQNSQYGKASMFQTPRNTRFEVHYNF